MQVRMGYAEDSRVCRFEGLAAAGFGKLGGGELYACCVAGASLIDDVERMLHDAGFIDIRIQPKDESKTFIRQWAPGTNLSDHLVSASIEAVKP
jgi:hypothetical protein